MKKIVESHYAMSLLAVSPHFLEVNKFMEKAGQLKDTKSYATIPSQEIRKLRASSIMEEAMETCQALGFDTVIYPDGKVEVVPHGEPNLVEIVDGCCDIAVVTTGTLIACGVPDVFVQDMVNQSNLAKFAEGHSFREDGKLIKPANWKKPNLEAALALLESLND